MNTSLPPLPRLIEFLRDATRADPREWQKLSQRVDGLPRVTLGEAGDVAFILSSSARNLLRQLPHATGNGEMVRMSLCYLTDALQMELNAHGAQPYHIDKG